MHIFIIIIIIIIIIIYIYIYIYHRTRGGQDRRPCGRGVQRGGGASRVKHHMRKLLGWLRLGWLNIP